jgi:hypothetical protein
MIDAGRVCLLTQIRRLHLGIKDSRFRQPGVDESDHPGEALIRIGTPLKRVAGLEDGVAVHRAAQHTDRVVAFVGRDAIAGQNGPRS